MTEELFRQDAYRVETPAKIAVCDERGVVLDRTVFYPRGGGQAGDAGVLTLGDGSAVAIADTIKGDGSIVHVPASGQEAAIAKLMWAGR